MEKMLELISKEQVIDELISRSENYNAFSLPNLTKIGIEISNLNTVFLNFANMKEKAVKAKSYGCFIEYIVLMSNFLEFYLKIYLNGKEINFDVDGSLGHLKNKLDSEFDLEIKTQLENFNNLRRKIVHRLHTGEYNLNDLEISEIEEFSTLPPIIENYVQKMVGKHVDITNLQSIPGESIFWLPK